MAFDTVRLLCMVNLLRHSVLLWRPPRADILFLGFTRSSLFKKRVHTIVILRGVVKTLRRSNSLSRSVFSMAGSFGGVWVVREIRSGRMCSEGVGPGSSRSVYALECIKMPSLIC